MIGTAPLDAPTREGPRLAHQLEDVGRTKAPLDDTAVVELVDDGLTHQHAVERVRVADAVDHEDPL